MGSRRTRASAAVDYGGMDESGEEEDDWESEGGGEGTDDSEGEEGGLGPPRPRP